MAPPKRPWFRFYVEAVHDRKLRRLKPEIRWLFVACLAAARQSPTPGRLLVTDDDAMTYDDLADFAGMARRQVEVGMDELVAAGVLAHEDDGWHVPAWGARQFESDDVTARTRSHRDRTSKERSKNGDATPDGTPPETEADTESRTSSSGSAEPGGCADRDDDDPIVSGAARALAELDLERREAEAGSVGHRDRWLAVAVRKRTTEVRSFLGGKPDPSVTVTQVVEALAPKAGERPSETRVSFDETVEQQLARLRAQRDLVDDERDREAIEEQIAVLERRVGAATLTHETPA